MSLPPQSSGLDLYAAGQLNRIANAQSITASGIQQQNSLLAEQNRLQQRREELQAKRRSQLNLLHSIKSMQFDILQKNNIDISDLLNYVYNIATVFRKSDFSLLENVEELNMKRDIEKSINEDYNEIRNRIEPNAVSLYDDFVNYIKSANEIYDSLNSSLGHKSNEIHSFKLESPDLKSELDSKSRELNVSKYKITELEKAESNRFMHVIGSIPFFAIAAYLFAIGSSDSSRIILVSIPLTIFGLFVARHPFTAKEKISKLKDKINTLEPELLDYETKIGLREKRLEELNLEAITIEDKKSKLQDEYNQSLHTYRLKLGIPENFELVFEHDALGNWTIGGFQK